ncbi:hypothetical protein [Streptomyces mirabilis]|uniref:hypothetical protein n=1 Tax=Streptomyces mirabilis TaxID=68239 RepID=UPI00339F2AB3
MAAHPLLGLERPGNPGIQDFRRAAGPGLLVPTRHKDVGASAVDAVRVQRAIGTRSPSLAVATTMHHFSMASLVLLSERGEGLEWLLMESVATEARLLASGFAEGRPGAGILQPTMSAVAEPGGLRVTGFKRPCSLSRSMDLLTASIRVARLDGAGAGAGDQLAVAMIPANSEGLSVSSFWGPSRWLARRVTRCGWTAYWSPKSSWCARKCRSGGPWTSCRQPGSSGSSC